MLEAHLTLDVSGQTEALRRRVARLGAKLICIELSQGDWPRQLMVSAPLARADELSPLVSRVEEVCELRVVRSKLEAPIDHDAAALYLEHHVKVHALGSAMGALDTLAREHAAHSSRNAFRIHRDGFEERFLTRRFSADASDEEASALATLLAALEQRSLTVLKVERERVLYDDRLALDVGWLPEVRA